MNPVFKTISTWYRGVLRNPKYRGWVILGTLIYLLSPLDISPDVVPILGQVDDVAILFLLMSELWQMFRDGFEVSEERVGEAESGESSSQKGNTVDVDAVSVE